MTKEVKRAASSVELNPLIAERWSPRSFDSSYVISDTDLNAILEAGRWAPSASNFQPWRFIVGRRGGTTFTAIAETLQDSNRLWAPNASLLIVLSALMVNDSGSARPASRYDAGIASAFMVVEAASRGLVTHQMAGFDGAALSARFKLPESITPLTILAIGRQGDVEALTDEGIRARELAPRSRFDLSELILASD